jgi:ADP-heptose:LPS heptosyltransferase
MGRPALLIDGMHGLGDNLHQRAVVRGFLKGHDVWLRTPWPAVYHDLVASAPLRLLPANSRLRTQAKNERREAARFANLFPINPRHERVWYSPDAVRRQGAVLSAMLAACGLDLAENDFRLPVPQAWRAQAHAALPSAARNRPLLIYRPLVERREWAGCSARNPDHAAYAELFEHVRRRFFVVSLADLADGAEWLVGRHVAADLELHRGELAFEAMAGLFAEAALVFTAPGFAVPLAQAVGTPVACVFGGYENSQSFSAGARFAPYLGLDPIEPCACFAHHHACKKAIDLPAAKVRLNAFVSAHVDTRRHATPAHRAVRA